MRNRGSGTKVTRGERERGEGEEENKIRWREKNGCKERDKRGSWEEGEENGEKVVWKSGVLTMEM